jgi:hypothetical protein
MSSKNEGINTVANCPVKTNNVVDPSAYVTDVSDVDFVPKTKTELDVVLRQIIKTLPIDKIPEIFKAISKLVNDTNDSDIKKELAKSSNSDYGTQLSDEHKNKPQANWAEPLVKEALEFDEFITLAQQLGFAISVKAIVDDILQALHINADACVVLEDINTYLTKLCQNGELSPADVQLIKAHPDLINEFPNYSLHLIQTLKTAANKKVNLKNG